MRGVRTFFLCVGCSLLAWVPCLSRVQPARAQVAQDTSLELSFVPTDRTQIAVWVERDDGTFMGTLALTHAVARLGIGNRPGALQMNSGFRWPYGRREGVLPIWAHRRAAAPGARRWNRVIFQDRSSEGYASRTSTDQSLDDYYCLSFQKASTTRDALDAVTCASVFSSDKGRFLLPADEGYAEPFETEDGSGMMRVLDVFSLYPPRRDVDRCTASGCFDHPDVASYRRHALDVMPELDAVSQATPQGGRRVTWMFPVPNDWAPDAGYILNLEVNLEGDYNDSYDPDSYPTPLNPDGTWDTWAEGFGYPYRGQPSVLYALPFRLDTDTDVIASVPAGYGSLHGDNGEVHGMDGTIADDPRHAPGSGADRLRMFEAARVNLHVARCLSDDPSAAPGAVEDLRVEEHPDRQRAHMWARMSFLVPESVEPIAAFDVRVKAEGSDWEPAFTPDSAQELLPVALDVCADPDNPMGNRCRTLTAGTELSVDLAGLKQSTRYQIAVTPRSTACNRSGPTAYAEFSTPARTFSTVSPCFIATASYGSPLASQIGVLRHVRDRYLATHGPGRALIASYYAIGPALAGVVRDTPWLRGLVRGVLDPVVALSSWWLP